MYLIVRDGNEYFVFMILCCFGAYNGYVSFFAALIYDCS